MRLGSPSCVLPKIQVRTLLNENSCFLHKVLVNFVKCSRNKMFFSNQIVHKKGVFIQKFSYLFFQAREGFLRVPYAEVVAEK